MIKPRVLLDDERPVTCQTRVARLAKRDASQSPEMEVAARYFITLERRESRRIVLGEPLYVILDDERFLRVPLL